MNRIFWFLLTLLYAGALNAQPANTLLWEISGNGLMEPSYVFGTFHMMCPEQLDLTADIQQKVQATRQLVLELDFDDPNLVPELQQGMVFADGKTTRDYLSEKDYQTVSRFFQDSLGISFDQVAAVKPFMLSTFIYPKYLGRQPASWEQALIGLAQGQQSEILGLETPTQQLATIDKLPFDKQAAVLVEGITGFDSMKKIFAEMVHLYRTQQLEALYAFSGDYFSEYEGLEKAMLEDRNRTWIPRMAELAAQKPTFFAVGAAHLGGPTGVLNLLREAGFRVTPVLPAKPTETETTTDNPTVRLLARQWRLDETVIPQVVESVLDNVRKQSPEQAAQLEGQKEALAQGLRGSTFEYKGDGTFKVSTFGQLRTGTWKLSDDGKRILKVDSDGEESANDILELTENRLVVLNNDKQRLVYNAR